MVRNDNGAGSKSLIQKDLQNKNSDNGAGSNKQLSEYYISINLIRNHEWVWICDGAW